MRILHVGYSFRPFHFGGLISYAEDLMDEQVALGDDVHYFFTGRHYPLVPPFLRRWTRRGVTMHELVNSPVFPGAVEIGTRRPDLDVEEPKAERAFTEVLETVAPDVVHVHDLGGLPSSVLEVPGRHGVPVLMTLQDYFPVCPTVKLFDVDEMNCRRLEPAPQCVHCCRDAPARHAPINNTLGTHKRHLARRFPLIAAVPGPRTIAQHVERLRLRRSADQPAAPADDQPSDRRDTAGDIPGFQRRREANVRRLGAVDRLVPMSERVAEIYTSVGVDPARMEVIKLTVGHIDTLRPRTIERVEGPVRFVTLNGCATPAKGARVVADALEELEALGLTAADLTFSIAGHPSHYVYDRLKRSPFTRFLGNYAPESLDALLDGYDVGVVPSVWEEAYGYVGVEMLAKGLPVIGNAVGGIPEYTLDGETGWVNRACTGRGLARIIAEIVREPAQIVELNAKIRARRSEFVTPMRAHAERIGELYAELAGQSSSTAASAG